MKFTDLGLSEDVLRAVADAGYTDPTPIQAQAIPVVLMGRDVLGCAQTGTGKTAGFTLPMIEILAAGQAKARMPRSLILEPTRELAAQVAQAFEVYGKYHKLNKALLIGGESMNDQIKVLDRGVDVLIATPGRLLDMFERGRLLLSDVKILVIDEADRMLDMGFIPDVERIVSLLSRIRQTLFFSATMPPEIRRLADAFLSNPKTISVSPPSSAAETVQQGLIMVPVPRGAKPGAQKEKRAALRELLASEDVRNALVFCNRKRDVGVLCRSLTRHGHAAGQLHGDMAQSARTETLAAFKRGEIKLLVCSDVAARGLDIQDMSHVFNFDVPSHAEDYIHRIGRTGRAGRAGRALTIATSEDRKYLAAITRMLGKPIPPLEAGPVAAPAPAAEPESEDEGEPAPKGRRRGRRRGGRSGETEAEATTPAKPQSREPAKAEAAKPAKEQPKKATKPAPRAAAKADTKSKESDGPVRGMGDHVPAFMMRAVPTSAAKSDDDAEDVEIEDDEDAVDQTDAPEAKPARSSKSPRARKPSSGKRHARHRGTTPTGASAPARGRR